MKQSIISHFFRFLLIWGVRLWFFTILLAIGSVAGSIQLQSGLMFLFCSVPLMCYAIICTLARFAYDGPQ